METKNDVVYAIVDSKNMYVGDSVYRSRETAQLAIENLKSNGKKDLCVCKSILPFAKRSVCYLHLYKGYDYDWEAGNMFDICTVTQLYPCSSMCKQSATWKSFKEKADKDPDRHIITDDMIASVQYGFKYEEHDKIVDAFFYGDVMEGKFNLKIKRLKVRP